MLTKNEEYAAKWLLEIVSRVPGSERSVQAAGAYRSLMEGVQARIEAQVKNRQPKPQQEPTTEERIVNLLEHLGFKREE